MLNLQLARKYSKAMFELAQEEGKLIPFGDELASVKKDLASAPQLKGYLANPQIQRQDKKELLRKLFAMFSVGWPAKVDKGIGAIAVYI